MPLSGRQPSVWVLMHAVGGVVSLARSAPVLSWKVQQRCGSILCRRGVVWRDPFIGQRSALPYYTFAEAKQSERFHLYSTL